jgi:uncharacterized protein (DUF1501 family)
MSGHCEKNSMDRRTMLGALGGAAVGFAMLDGQQAAAADDADKGKALADCGCKCTEACSNAMNWCNETFLYASREATAGKRDYAKVMHLWNDCGEICGSSAKLVARTSPLMAHICRACAASCDDCVTASEKLDDAKLKEAIAAVRACSKSCRDMLEMMGVNAK